MQVNCKNRLVDFNISENISDAINIYYTDSRFFTNETEMLTGLLSKDEINQAKRFRRTDDVSSYMVSHAILRCLISERNKIKPNKINIESKDNQKPYVKNLELDFNISHSDNLCCIAIANSPDLIIGIDIEIIKKIKDFKQIARNYMSGNEQNYILDREISEENKQLRFMEIWTRKEALLKMTGKGLVNDLKSIEVLNGDNIVLCNELEDAKFKTNNAFIVTYSNEQFVISISLNKKQKSVLKKVTHLHEWFN